MKEILIIFLALLVLLFGCTRKDGVDFNNSLDSSLENNDVYNLTEEIEKENIRNIEDDDIKWNAENIKECIYDFYNYFYPDDSLDSLVLECDNESFSIWKIAGGINRNHEYSEIHLVLVTYKDITGTIYCDNKPVWQNGKSIIDNVDIYNSEGQKVFPYFGLINNGPINIRNDHTTNSDKIGILDNGEKICVFDEFQNENLSWYKIYLEDIKKYAWVANNTVLKIDDFLYNGNLDSDSWIVFPK